MAGACSNSKREVERPETLGLRRRGTPQSFGERAHHGDGEIGRLMHEEEEVLLGDGSNLAGGATMTVTAYAVCSQ